MEANDSTTSEVVQAIVQIIFGEPASKANSRRVVRIAGQSRLIKSSKALNYSQHFKRQTRPIEPLIETDVRVTMKIFYASRRPDLDESLILDLLQGVVYVNDRQVKEKHIYWGLDKDCPRTEIAVEPLPMPEKKTRTRRA
jgi:Holliday junction resolvase RusA-like endonuclease